jgi:hypothetical protein
VDTTDVAAPRLVARLDYHPPMAGFTHTVLPLPSRDLLVTSDESVHDGGDDQPKRVWLADASDERAPLIIGSLPLPPVAGYATRVRAFDMRDPFQPRQDAVRAGRPGADQRRLRHRTASSTRWTQRRRPAHPGVLRARLRSGRPPRPGAGGRTGQSRLSPADRGRDEIS